MDHLLVAVATNPFALSVALTLVLAGAGLLADRRRPGAGTGRPAQRHPATGGRAARS